jgi:hypothetical protein
MSMRILIYTTVLAFLAGVAGSFVGSRFFVAESVYAQNGTPRVLRVERLELVDQTGKVTGQLDGANPQLEFRSQAQGQESSVLINSSTIRMKSGQHDVSMAPGFGLLVNSGQNSIALSITDLPQVIVSSTSGIASVSATAIDIEDRSRKVIWATPIVHR